MADTALFIGWGYPHPGREAKAITVLNESIQYWKQLQQRGDIESFEVAMLNSRAGDLGGFALLRGSQDKLAVLRASPEFQRHSMRASLVAQHLDVVEASTGEQIMAMEAMYQEDMAELTAS